MEAIERVLDARANGKALKIRSDVHGSRAYDNGFRIDSDLTGRAFFTPIVSLGVIPESLRLTGRFQSTAQLRLWNDGERGAALITIGDIAQVPGSIVRAELLRVHLVRVLY